MAGAHRFHPRERGNEDRAHLGPRDRREDERLNASSEQGITLE
jgi:hypothetical protein